MLRKLIVTALLLNAATGAIAQNSKITEKEPATETDYKLMGAPMPPLLYIIVHDTAAKKDANTPVVDDSRKKKRKREAQAMLTSPLEQQVVTNKDLDNGANLFVMMFNPTCSHCADEVQLMEKNIALFKKSRIALIANKMMQPYLPDFMHTMHTEDYAPISVGYDSTAFIGNVFLYSSLPQINVYSCERKLLRTFSGEVAIDSLKQYIE